MRYYIIGFFVFCCIILITLYPAHRVTPDAESGLLKFLQTEEPAAATGYIQEQFVGERLPSWNRVFTMAEHGEPNVRYQLFVRVISDFPPSPNREALLQRLYHRDPGDNRPSMREYAEALATSPTLILVDLPPVEERVANN